MKPKVLVPLAAGCEEMEAVIVIDVLRRAGLEVVVAGLAEGMVRASRGVALAPDTTLAQTIAVEGMNGFAAIVLPGGAAGAAALRDDARILELLRSQAGAGRICAAICAAPTVLERAGLLRGRRATSHPSVQAELREAGVEIDGAARVVIDGPFVTSQSPGTTFEFAYALVELLVGRAKVDELEASIQSRR
jgi:protein deglycase